MLISHSLKYVFIHVPKTAGTSIECLLKEEPAFQVDEIGHWYGASESDYEQEPKLCRQLHNHSSAKKVKEYFEEMGWKWDEYFKFGFMRNPWDLQVSQHCYFMQSLTESNTSDENLKLIEEYKNKPAYEFIKSRAKFDFIDHFLCDKNKNIIVDFIGKFENLNEDFQKIQDKIGVSGYSLPAFNQSKRIKNYQVYYDDEAREQVKKSFYKTISLGNYTFGDGACIQNQ